MNTEIIEVKSILPPGDGKKQFRVETMDGMKLGAWPKDAPLIKPGHRYEVECSDWTTNRGNKARTITKCKPLESPPKNNGHSNNSTPSIPDSAREQAFVVALLSAAIQSQQVEMNDRSLKDATQILRLVWRGTFGQFGG